MNRNWPSCLENIWVNIFLENFIIVKVAPWCLPCSVDNLFIILFFEDTIASKDDEIIIIPNFEAFDIWCRDNTFRISTVSWIFSLDISNGSRNGETTRKHSMWTNYHLHPWGIIRRGIRHIALVLIDLSTVLLHPLCLSFILWLMILGKQQNLLSAIHRHYSSTISDICHIAKVSHNQYNNCTCSTPLNEVIFWSTLLVCPLKKHLLTLSNTIFNCNLGIFGKVIISDYQLVKLISQKVCTSSTSMAIVNCEERASGPFVYLFELRLNNIKNNRNPIFIIIPNNTLMGISCIGAHHPIFFTGEFGWVVWLDVTIYLLLLHFYVFLLLLDCHDEATISY